MPHLAGPTEFASSNKRSGEPTHCERVCRQEQGFLGLVWADFPDHASALGLERALKDKARVRRGQRAPKSGRPALVVSWAGAPREAVERVEHAGAEAPGVPVVVFGPVAELASARAAVRAGARGFVHARMGPEQIARAFSVALGGEVVFPRELLGELLEGERPPDLAALGERKLEILGLVAEGLSNAQVARRLFLSESNVKQHLTTAYGALGVKNRRQAARLVRRNT